LKRVKNVLPYVESCVGVSEGKNYEIFVDAYDTLDILSFLFNWMSVDRLVLRSANFAFPVVEVAIIITADN
jgi:hypothetical protein